jgi:hypothetical protein
MQKVVGNEREGGNRAGYIKVLSWRLALGPTRLCLGGASQASTAVNCRAVHVTHSRHVLPATDWAGFHRR